MLVLLSVCSNHFCSFFFFFFVVVVELPLFGKQLLTVNWLTICSLFILTIVISRFGFEWWVWVLTASVPGLCKRFTFNGNTILNKKCISILRLHNDFQRKLLGLRKHF